MAIGAISRAFERRVEVRVVWRRFCRTSLGFWYFFSGIDVLASARLCAVGHRIDYSLGSQIAMLLCYEGLLLTLDVLPVSDQQYPSSVLWIIFSNPGTTPLVQHCSSAFTPPRRMSNSQFRIPKRADSRRGASSRHQYSNISPREPEHRASLHALPKEVSDTPKTHYPSA